MAAEGYIGVVCVFRQAPVGDLSYDESQGFLGHSISVPCRCNVRLVQISCHPLTHPETALNKQ